MVGHFVGEIPESGERMTVTHPITAADRQRGKLAAQAFFMERLDAIFSGDLRAADHMASVLPAVAQARLAVTTRCSGCSVRFEAALLRPVARRAGRFCVECRSEVGGEL